MDKVRSFLLLLIALILVVFTVGNRELVSIDLWPFMYETTPVPIFVVFFAGILIGIGLSAIIMAIRGAKNYAELRSAKKEKEKLSSEVESLEHELDKKPANVDQKDYSEEGPGAPKKLSKGK